MMDVIHVTKEYLVADFIKIRKIDLSYVIVLDVEFGELRWFM